MLYNDGVKMDDNKRVLICPQCENEGFDKEAEFCKICGHLLFNYCTGGEYENGDFPVEYKHPNVGNARYCEFCGAKTTFLNSGVLKAWDYDESKPPPPPPPASVVAIAPIPQYAPQVVTNDRKDDDYPF